MSALISLVCLFIVSSLSLTNGNVFVRNYKGVFFHFCFSGFLLHQPGMGQSQL